MEMLSKVGEAMQRLLDPVADAVAERTNVIQRKREFTSMSLAMTFVLGYLWKPRASLEDLAKMAMHCGVMVSPQAVDQRRTHRLVDFLEQLFHESLKIVVASHESLAPLLARFTQVIVADSSTVTLPDSLRKRFPGCGGAHGQGKAALKLQTELDLRYGTLSHIEIEQGKSPDAATCRQSVRHAPGTLKITDLGYFNVPIFAALVRSGMYFLSRLQFGTGVLLSDGVPVKLLDWLKTQPGPFVDCSILLGLKDRLPCRLIAWRVPEELANRRRQKLIADMRSRKGKEPSAERLLWCDWCTLVTNVPAEMLTAEESVVLYRARWQIELLFKRWKSQGLIAALQGSTDARKMVGLWSRLIACVIQHWLLMATAWGDIRISLDKAGQTIRDFTAVLVTGLCSSCELVKQLSHLREIIQKTCRRNKRTAVGTFELLNNPGLLNFRLN